MGCCFDPEGSNPQSDVSQFQEIISESKEDTYIYIFFLWGGGHFCLFFLDRFRHLEAHPILS